MATLQARLAGYRPRVFAPRIAGDSRSSGFSLIEVIVTLLILSLLSAFAFSSFNSYVRRARAADALEQLDIFRTRMEKAFQDNGNYGVGACAINLPAGVDKFDFSCVLGPNGQSFTGSATGSGTMAGYVFSINELGFRRTESFPGAAVPADCWMVEANKCR